MVKFRVSSNNFGFDLIKFGLSPNSFIVMFNTSEMSFLSKIYFFKIIGCVHVEKLFKSYS